MKRNRILIFIAGFFLISITLYNNCANVGFGRVQNTSTIGNPMNPTQASSEILFAICSVLDRCQAQVPFNVCMNGVLGVNGIGSRLGLAPGIDNPYSALENAESSGAITANLTTQNTCVDAINNLSCNNPNVLNAYNASSSSPFAGVSYMVPISSCGQVFASPVQSYACSTQVFLRGVTNAANSPSNSGMGLSYSITPALPSGLTLNPTTGTISGTPTVVTPMTAYTLTASNSFGSSTNTLNIMTADGYLVNDLSDAHNVGPGCTTSSGTCTLRAAMEAINSGGALNTVLLPPGTITLTLGSQLSANQGMQIYGDCAQNTSVDGNASTRVFFVSAGPTTLANLIIQNGNSNDGAGGVLITAQSGNLTATLQNITVQNNTNVGSLQNGGGILTIGSSYTSTVNINNCSIQNNSAVNEPGGGIDIDDGSNVTLSNCTFSGNTAPIGGAVLVNGMASISQSLFENNTATSLYGGAIYCSQNNGSLTLTNDTIFGNTGVQTGGVATGNKGSVNILNSTITNNTSTGMAIGGGVANTVGGLSITISNSIVAANRDTSGLHNCSSGGIMVSDGYNMSDNRDCSFNATGDKQNVNPMLGPLQNNGGFTFTEGLLPGSFAIDASNPIPCPPLDQRGYLRHLPSSCDSGAFEHEP